MTATVHRPPLIVACLVFLTLFLGPFARADQNDEWFRQANDQYRNGHFQEALDTYQRILDGGFESGALYYNMGNCHYRLGHLGESILFYEKARRLIPEDEDLEANLALTEAKTIDKITPLPRFWLREGLEILVFWFPRGLVWALLAVAYMGAVAAWIARILSGRSKIRLWMGRMTLGLVLAGVGLAGILGIRALLSEQKEGVVLADSVKAFSGPGEEGAQVFVLHEGTRVRLDKRSGEWVEVTLADGNVGWIPDDALAEI